MKYLIKLITILSITLSQLSFALPDDVKQPIEIQADEASFDQKTGEAIYQGNVFIRQGSIEIQAQYLKIITNPETQQFSELIATGKPAKFSQQLDLNGNIVISQGNKIHYITSKSKLEISGNGYLSRKGNKIEADHIQYMLNSGTFNAEKKDSGRVSITLPPPKVEAKK